MTGGQKLLTFFAVLSGLLWIILGAIGANKAKTASFFGSDSDLATVVALKAASGDSFLIMIMAIIGLCVAAAVREMLNPPAGAAGQPGADTTAAVPVTTPIAAPADLVEPSAAPDVQSAAEAADPTNAGTSRPE